MQSPFIGEWEDELPTMRSKFDASIWEGVSPFEEIPSEQQFFDILPDFGKIFSDWQEKAHKNKDYANRLGWSKYSSQISNLLLKNTGQSNSDYSSAHFAALVAQWQAKNGFSGKDVDGIIGPNTWKKMQQLLKLPSGVSSHSVAINSPTIARVQQYSSLIERISKELGFNPNIVRGIIAAESGGNRYSGKGGKGYKGLMQARRDEDQFDPETSIRTGIRLFIEMRDRNLGPRLSQLGIDRSDINNETFLRLVLCSYNAGHVSVLKALSYANDNGNWRDWFEGPYYKRALLFTGAYSKYAKCGTEDIEKAQKDAAFYKFKRGSHWQKQSDPPKWEEVIKTISPLLRCWIETKHGNTPGYLNKIIGYFKYFEGLGASQEFEDEESVYESEFTNKPSTENLVGDYEEEDEFNDNDEFESRHQISEDFELSHEMVNYENEILTTTSSYFLPELNTKKTALNQNQIKKLGLPYHTIISALKSHVDIRVLSSQLQERNAKAVNQNYSIDPTFTRVDSVFTEAVHQFQIGHFIDSREHDGILGRSTLETLGIYSHGLKAKLNSSRFYGKSQLNRKDIAPNIPILTNNEYTSSNWYDHIIKPAFLGIKISDGIHVILYQKLKEAEKWLRSQPQFSGLSPAKLGIALGFNSSTRYSGARLSSAKQAMHGFGLALDINVAGNPWIGAGWIKHDPKLLMERYRMLDALKKASGLNLPGKTVFEYLNHIAQSEGTDTHRAYATLKARHDEFVALLKNDSNELSYWKRSQTFGKRNPLNGFLNLHPDLVYALRQISGLAWGAIDFGPRASGDIMHFDLRMEGIGKYLCQKIGGYVPKSGHPRVNHELLSDEVDFLESPDFSEFHEAEGEAELTGEENKAYAEENIASDNFTETEQIDEGYVDESSFELLNEPEDYESSDYEMYMGDSVAMEIGEEEFDEELEHWELDNENNGSRELGEDYEERSEDDESYDDEQDSESDLLNEEPDFLESGEEYEEESFYKVDEEALEEIQNHDCRCKEKYLAEEMDSFNETEKSSGILNYHNQLGQGKSILISESEMPDEQEVFNPDTRKQVTQISNIHNVPFRWICSITFYFRDPDDFGRVIEFEGGSGLLISSCHVLTSAHQIYAEISGSKGSKQKQRALRAIVYPGRDGSSFTFGQAESSNFAYPSSFTAGLDARWDFGLIKLKQKIGLQTFNSLNNQPLGYWGSKNWGKNTYVKALSTNYLKSQIVNISGYPKSKNNKQYLAYDRVKASPPTINGKPVNELITYLVDTSEGQSGSPVWKYIKKTGKRYLVAIHRGGCHANLDGCLKSGKVSSNMGVLISQSVINQIQSWIKTM